MANLVTPDYLRSLDRLRVVRSVVVLALLFSIAAMVGIIALTPSLIIARQERGTIQAQVSVVKAAIDGREDQVGSVVLRDARDHMQLAQKISDRGTRMTEALTKTLAVPGGIQVVGLTYERRADGAGTIVVSGNASSRDTLAAYAETLRGNSMFTGVTVPLATVPRTGGEFSVTITGDF